MSEVERRRRWLNPEQEGSLRQFVANRRPTTDEAIVFVRDSWGVTYTQTGMRNTLKRLGAFLRNPIASRAPHTSTRSPDRACQWRQRGSSSSPVGTKSSD